MKENHLYFGQFNWYGETFRVWKHAPNVNKAYFLMIREIAQKMGLSEYRLRQYFNGSKDNYKVERRIRKGE